MRERSPTSVFYRNRAAFSTPKRGPRRCGMGALLRGKEERLDASVSEIHRHPLRPPGFAKQRVARVIERWREVRGWWEPGGGTDRLLFRVLLSGGSVVDLAVERSEERAGAWSLVRVLD